MRRIKLYFGILAIAFSCSLQAQENVYLEKDNRKIHAIEHLWLDHGIPVMLKEWAANDSAKTVLAGRFQSEYAPQIDADRREFFAFVNDPKVLYPELAQPRQWLKDKQAGYYLQLNNLYTKGMGVGPGLPAIMSSSYIPPTPPPVPQCLYADMDASLTDWVPTIGQVSPIGITLFGAYSPVVGTYDPLARIQSYSNPGFPYDQLVGGTALTKIYPGSSWSVKLENNENGYGYSQITRHFTVDASDPWIVVRYAIVLQDPGDHDDGHRPFFEVKVLDPSNVSIPCAYYRVIAKPPIEGFAQVPNSTYYWRDWTTMIIPLDDYAGLDVTLQFSVGDCALGGHLGYAYIDGACIGDDLSLNTLCTPYQTITAPKGFDFYFWTGEQIPGDNFRNTLQVKKAGTYQVELTNVSGCTITRDVVVPDDCPESPIVCNLTGITANPSDCDEMTNTYTLTGQVNIGSITDGYLVITAGNETRIYPGPFSGILNYEIPGLPANGQSVPVTFRMFTSRHISAYTLSCDEATSFEAPEACATVTFACEDCIKGFAPNPDQNYVVSTWVKKDSPSALDYTYANPFVKVGLYDGSTWTYHTFYPEGEIIDGWQRISEEFYIPNGTTQVSVQLGTTSHATYFDDIRLYPADGSFKSFVYDPINLRLLAELDENNYATFYEYDEEGALVRIKKETERGVMTIQENRNYKVKKP